MGQIVEKCNLNCGHVLFCTKYMRVLQVALCTPQVQQSWVPTVRCHLLGLPTKLLSPYRTEVISFHLCPELATRFLYTKLIKKKTIMYEH